jgi:hypothetical protein
MLGRLEGVGEVGREQGRRGVGKAIGRRTVIEGTYGFVYCSVTGFGMGVFTIKGEQFIGVDSGGVNYDGTAKEQEDGSIVLDAHAAICDDAADRFRRWKAARDFIRARQRYRHDQASSR